MTRSIQSDTLRDRQTLTGVRNVGDVRELFDKVLTRMQDAANESGVTPSWDTLKVETEDIENHNVSMMDGYTIDHWVDMQFSVTVFKEV